MSIWIKCNDIVTYQFYQGQYPRVAAVVTAVASSAAED